MNVTGVPLGRQDYEGFQKYQLRGCPIETEMSGKRPQTRRNGGDESPGNRAAACPSPIASGQKDFWRSGGPIQVANQIVLQTFPRGGEVAPQSFHFRFLASGTIAGG